MTTSITTPVSSTSDWAGSPMSTLHPAAHKGQQIPVEQYSDGASYVIRLEVPGVDPARDLAVSVRAGTLSVRAERRYAIPEDGQSEFLYGRLARDIALPLGSNVQDVSATCRDGILTVRIGMEPEHQQEARRVEVRIEPARPHGVPAASPAT
jgi:HSP20 family molecular chaperone IbpA